jgi:hypothetical protein
MSLPISENINWTDDADPSCRQPCCPTFDPCPNHYEDPIKCHECFSKTAAHKVYCSSAPLCMKHDGLLEFVCPLDPQELEFVMNYIKENDNRPNIELHQHFANQIETWKIMGQLYTGFLDFNENSECISFDLTFLYDNDEATFIELTLKALMAYRDL